MNLNNTNNEEKQVDRRSLSSTNDNINHNDRVLPQRTKLNDNNGESKSSSRTFSCQMSST